MPEYRVHHDHHHHIFTSTVTVEELAGSPLSDVEKAAQLAVTGRKNWKTLRDKGEAVWPLKLESALLEALEKYRPPPVRKGHSVRFPLRNRFISDYILRVTGKYRTPKQVGSRLQQLRETCDGEVFRLIICGLDAAPLRHNSSSLSSTSSNTIADGAGHSDYSPPPYSPATGCSNGSRPDTTSPLGPQVNSSRDSNYLLVDVMLDVGDTSTPTITLPQTASMEPHKIALARIHSSGAPQWSLANNHILFQLDSTIRISSPYPLSPKTKFLVYANGPTHSAELIHRDHHDLTFVATPYDSGGCGWTYSTTLVPKLWQTICSDQAPERYQIVQEFYPLPNTLTSARTIVSNPTTLLYSMKRSSASSPYQYHYTDAGVCTIHMESSTTYVSPPIQAPSPIPIPTVHFDLSETLYTFDEQDPVESQGLSYSYSQPEEIPTSYSTIGVSSSQPHTLSYGTGNIQPHQESSQNLPVYHQYQQFPVAQLHYPYYVAEGYT